MNDASKQKRRPVMLVILDGWGWREEAADNAVRQAKTPSFDRLWATGPHAFLRTDGREVGLPPGQMGNSEVGHLNIGAGRVVMQDLPRIGDAIASGEIKTAPALTGLIAALKKSGGTCHLIGLVSPGGVHSHQDHAAALAKILADAGVPTVAHAITDGRDTPPQSAGDDLKRFTAALPASVPVATVLGRYYAMDRDKRWERVAKAYDAMVEADGPRFPDAQAAIADAYAKQQFDEFIVPGGDRRLSRHEGRRRRAVLQLPRRPRARNSRRHARSGFLRLPAPAQDQVRRGRRHDAVQRRPRQAACGRSSRRRSFPNILGEVVADAGRTQLRMAETEKYPHVTYFLNGGREEPYRGRGPHHGALAQGRDLRPAAGDVGAGADRQGGRGDRLRQVRPDRAELRQSRHGRPHRQPAGRDQGGGDGRHRASAGSPTRSHGRAARCWSPPTTAIARLMRDPVTGGPHTSHTTNPVPLLLLGRRQRARCADGRLADLAPTLLELMELPQPKEMTGMSLLRGD